MSNFNLCVFPAELSTALKMLGPLSRGRDYSEGGRPRILTPEGDVVPAKLAQHRVNYTRVGNRLFANVTIKVLDTTSVQELCDTYPSDAKLTPAVRAQLIRKLENSDAVLSRRGATPSQVQAYIEAEKKLVIWRIQKSLKTETANLRRNKQFFSVLVKNLNALLKSTKSKENKLRKKVRALENLDELVSKMKVTNK